ncbi:E3 ubiquitin-protein ligase RNF213-like [Discoglossus pictus]
MAANLHNYKESHIFNILWKREAYELAEKYQKGDQEDDDHGNDDDGEREHCKDYELSLEKMEKELFTPCFKKYQTISGRLKSGAVKLVVVDNFFNDYRNRYKELRRELQHMCHLLQMNKNQWIEERVLQIEQYHQLHVAFNSAKIIQNLKNYFNISGNFEALENLLQFADNFDKYKMKPLSCISSVLKTKQILSEITEERAECLQEVVLRIDFVNWVTESLRDVTELKVFVDLASIFAGENDMDVDRVACFNDAILGYSSLLYELKLDWGFDNLMNHLQKLWRALKSDRNLPKKLRDSARHLQWLKTVKKSHESVELSSLSLAATINKKGIYIIQAPSGNKKMEMDSVLSLCIEEDDLVQEGVYSRSFTLEELKELLNKLMLMSGKGNDGNSDVEKFSEIFSNVQRLANSFIDLCLAGNMLFRNWKTIIYCSDDNKYGIIMDFNLKVIGEIEAEGSAAELLPNICKMMENFLGLWIHFMDKTRSQHYYLNYYTAEQLMYLCQQFQRTDISEEACVMLSFIKPECTIHDIKNYLYHSRKVGLVKSSPEVMPFELKSDTDVLKKLEMIWENSFSYISSFFPDCLDMITLGMCLGSLSSTGQLVNRKLHPSLVQGRPNLVICHPSQILSSTIAIYMQDLEQALPSYDEVLLCTPKTTFEEVALFLRRCLISGYIGQKIYCLLYADELSYDTAYKAEQLFQELQAQSRHKYNLVIVCNSDREHCYIPSAFSQYKTHMTPQKSPLEVQQYLEHHFSVAKDAPCGSAPAFKNGMSVGIVASKRAGVGKSLYVKKLNEKLGSQMSEENVLLKTIRLIKPQVDENKVLQMLVPTLRIGHKAILFHIDIMSSVKSGISEFLFKLLVLQYLKDSEGRMWKRQPGHLYVIEILEVPQANFKKESTFVSHMTQFSFIDFFPKISCCTPKEVLSRNTENHKSTYFENPGMDEEEFSSEWFQRPFQYLIRFEQQENLDTFTYVMGSVEGYPAQCLQILLLYCGVVDPSWAELRNFAWFLNLQLKDCESSIFCNHTLVGDTLRGFKNFVVNFMILMAKDFATPSLQIADESPGRPVFNYNGVKEEDLAPFLMRKKWESEPHPYIFFNADHVSMTFIGFHLQRNNSGGVDAINPRNNNVIRKNIMSIQLYQGLQLQRVPFNVDFDQLPRKEKINILCMVLGIETPFDPDDTYELTLDNMLKILAIVTRFRSEIPVVIMGETGCGKTTLIKYMCKLLKGMIETENMKLVKVHGGTSADTIYAKILETQKIALLNKQRQCETVLFFDEANTTEAVTSIKEALCDHTVEGEPLIVNSGLQIIAACNPYRKHTEEMIKRLESAGLGYRVKEAETKEKLGSIPLRQLIYRVHALPPSMMPLVWDFGQLNNETENKYIQQIVQHLANETQLSSWQVQLLTNVFSASQSYMRERNDECSYVSLRDVERCIEVFKWFYYHSELLLNNSSESRILGNKRDVVTWSLILAVGVCYHASLENKDAYRKAISKYFPEPYKGDQTAILQEISNVQDLFLSSITLRDTIARNNALKENVFMMVICIELKIPLFLVGKPGSSKSLAKTIVADAMQGQAAHTDLYKDLKQIHLVSFQCSPHSTPEGIIATFNQCARFQENKNLNEYSSVVVLDEIGLAEDSPKMPLKTLHPLLEDGCIDDDPLPHQKVGFIGISNWALDPAKMNRGIFVSRGDPNTHELIESAKGICSSNKLILGKVDVLFSDISNAFQNICEAQNQTKGFFGLRDFYSLIKMLFAITKHFQRKPTLGEITRAVLRNFSGRDEVNALNSFLPNNEGNKYIEEINTLDLVMENIKSNSDDNECRYLLILTKNYIALQILQQAFCKENRQPEIIFGSSFPKDQEYTQICRNINRVKVCMETGQMVILLNLQNLYESLYDALNQYYVYLAGQKYVDLGLGTHRVKCRVHPNFRLIVIEEKEVVYKDFPIPLINRLEKHYMDINTVLTKEQKVIVQELEKWIQDFTTEKTKQKSYSPSDVFIGYHSDTCASVTLQVTGRLKQKHPNPNENIAQVKTEAKSVLINCATPDSIIRQNNKELIDQYFKKQKHNSLTNFIYHMRSGFHHCTVFTEVTTFSHLLTSADKKILEAELQNDIKCIELLSLQQFDTELSFLKIIRRFLEGSTGDKILIVQTDFEDGSEGAHLVASAKYAAVNEINKVNLNGGSVFVYFIIKLPRMQGGTSYVGFQGGLWEAVHIDDLRKPKNMVSDITALQNLTISQLFHTEVDMAGSTMRQEPPSHPKSNQKSIVEMGHNTNKIRQNKVEILDTTILIKTCLQNAIGMLRDEELIQSRSTRRIEILINLFNRNDSFLQTLKIRLHGMLKKREENSDRANKWIARVASDTDAVQEAGTFRRTLWKHIQGVVTPVLAHILSIVDSDANLEILVNPDLENCVKSLWMYIFNDEKLLNISYNLEKRSSSTDTILVKNYMNLPLCEGNYMPFSWRIKDYLEEMWAQTQYIDNMEGPEMNFMSIFSQTPLGQHFSKWKGNDSHTMVMLYVRDFILLTMNVSSSTELELMEFALLSCLEELIEHTGGEELTLPLVHLGYHMFQHRLLNLSRMLAINRACINTVTPSLKEHQPVMNKHMALDIYVAYACLEMLEASILEPSPQAWLHQIKNLQVPIELICSENYLQGRSPLCQQAIKQIKIKWNSMFSMALFIEHVLVDESVQNSQIQEVLRAHTILLGKCLQGFPDIKSLRPFLAVIDVLQKCRDAVGKSVLRDSMQKNAQFQQLCNGFFMDIVCTMCFKDSTPPDDKVIHQLLSLVFINKSGLKQYTKSLSPFDDSVDKTPVIRSVILKLLLKYSFDDIQKYVQKYLSTVQGSNFLSKEDITEVNLLFVNCLEDNHASKIDLFLVYGNNYKQLRDCIGNALFEYKEEHIIEAKEAHNPVKMFLQNHRVLQEGAIKQFVQSLLNNSRPILKVVPGMTSMRCSIVALSMHVAAVLLARSNNILEPLKNLAFSPGKMQNSYLPTMPEDLLDYAKKICKDVLTWYRCPNNHYCAVGECGKPMQQALCIDCGAKVGGVHHKPENGFALVLSGNTDRTQTGHILGDPEQQGSILAPDREIAAPTFILLRLLTHLAMILGAEHNSEDLKRIVKPQVEDPGEFLFRHIAKDLEQLKNTLGKSADETTTIVHLVISRFPKSLHQETDQWLAPSPRPLSPHHPKHFDVVRELGRIYSALQNDGDENEHYADDEPKEGELETLQKGLKRGARQSQSVKEFDQEFYRLVPESQLLSEADTRPYMVVLKEQLNAVEVLVRKKEAKLHKGESALSTEGQKLQQLQGSVNGLLAQATQPHVVELKGGMCHIVHPRRTRNFDSTLKTKNERNTWEKMMESTFMSPMLKSLDKDLLEVKNHISKDIRISSDVIINIVYGDPLNSVDHMTQPQNSVVNCSKMWACRKRISVEYLQHVAQQKDGKDTVPILFKFLNKEAELRLVKFLPDILHLQKDLVKQFQNNRDMCNQTIKDFIASMPSDFAKNTFEKQLKAFMFTWNHLRMSLQLHGEIRLPEDLCNTNITMDSDFAMLLPRRQGLGLCATALVSYLINLQNSFVQVLEKYTEVEQKYSIKASEVMDFHVISYELEKDVMPIILSNCQYSVEKGGETLEEFDLEKIERQICSRLLQGKPRITMCGLPTFVHSHDRNFENIFMNVKNRLYQESLPSSAINIMRWSLNSLSDVCEALHIVEVMLGFLAMTGGDEELSLTTYCDRVLQMREETNAQILEALKQCQVKHTIALWQLLTALKSEHLLHLKRDPFAEVDEAYKQKLNKESKQLLILFLEKNGRNLFLLELHELIMLKLKKTRSVDEFRPAWGLSETMVPILDGKDIQFPGLESDFPEQIALAHSIEAWKITAEKNWKHRQR